jgi:hypothetical protein
VLLLVAAAGCGASSTLTEDGLRKHAETVQSAAAEGALLAGDVARDRTTEPFARIHSGELADQATSAANSLAVATAPPGLDPDRRRAVATATRVSDALEQLHDRPTDERLARRVQRQLERDAETAGELAG